MITVSIDNSQIERAKELYPFDNLNGSITKGKSNIFGAIGEVIINDYFKDKGQTIDTNSTYDYDLIINSYKVDVKTKRFTPKFKPNNNWNVTVSDFNTTQQCNYYFFVGVSEDYKRACMYGYITPGEFYNKATFNKKGQIDPTGNGVWTFKDDCYNLKIAELTEFK